MGVENLFKTFSRAVTTAGTRVRVSSTDLFTSEVEVYVKSGNSGANMYLGGSDVSSTLGRPIAKGSGYTISTLKDQDGRINLKNLWLDADSNNDAAVIAYIARNQTV